MSDRGQRRMEALHTILDAKQEEILRKQGHAAGVRETLKRVAKLPTPVKGNGMSATGSGHAQERYQHFKCDWCHAEWQIGVYDISHRPTSHPANGCLFADALAAAQEDR